MTGTMHQPAGCAVAIRALGSVSWPGGVSVKKKHWSYTDTFPGTSNPTQTARIQPTKDMTSDGCGRQLDGSPTSSSSRRSPERLARKHLQLGGVHVIINEISILLILILHRRALELPVAQALLHLEYGDRSIIVISGDIALANPITVPVKR